MVAVGAAVSVVNPPVGVTIAAIGGAGYLVDRYVTDSLIERYTMPRRSPEVKRRLGNTARLKDAVFA